jgi:hypothetical protein
MSCSSTGVCDGRLGPLANNQKIEIDAFPKGEVDHIDSGDETQSDYEEEREFLSSETLHTDKTKSVLVGTQVENNCISDESLGELEKSQKLAPPPAARGASLPIPLRKYYVQLDEKDGYGRWANGAILAVEENTVTFQLEGGRPVTQSHAEFNHVAKQRSHFKYCDDVPDMIVENGCLVCLSSSKTDAVSLLPKRTNQTVTSSSRKNNSELMKKPAGMSESRWFRLLQNSVAMSYKPVTQHQKADVATPKEPTGPPLPKSDTASHKRKRRTAEAIVGWNKQQRVAGKRKKANHRRPCSRPGCKGILRGSGIYTCSRCKKKIFHI